MRIFAYKHTINQAEISITEAHSNPHEILTKYFTIFTHTLLRDQGFKSYVMYCTVLYCTELYCTVPYCTDEGI